MNAKEKSTTRSSQKIRRAHRVLAGHFEDLLRTNDPEGLPIENWLAFLQESGLSLEESTSICDLIGPMRADDWAAHLRNLSFEVEGSSEVVLDAVKELLDGHRAETCLDPWAGTAQLAAFVHEEARPKETFACNLSQVSQLPSALVDTLAPELQHFPIPPSFPLPLDLADADSPFLPSNLLEFTPDSRIKPLSSHGSVYLLPSSIPDDIDVVASDLSYVFGGPPNFPFHSDLPSGNHSIEGLRGFATAAAHDRIERDLRCDLGEYLLLAGARKLSPKGRALFVVPASFCSTEHSIWRKLQGVGFSIDAIFQLPSGLPSWKLRDGRDCGPTRDDRQRSTRNLLVVSRNSSTTFTTFIAELSHDLKVNRQVLSNFRKGVTDGPVVMGRMIETAEFRRMHVSLGTLQANELIQGKAENLGMQMMPLGHLASDITISDPWAQRSSVATGEATIREWEGPVEGFEDEELPVEEGFLSSDNCVFIPTRGNSDVVTSVSELTIPPRSHIQVVITPDLADAEFVAHFLNSESGRRVREHHSRRRHSLRMGLAEITALPILVPNLEEQEEVLEVAAMIDKKLSTLSSFGADLSDLDRELWANSRAMDVVKEKVLAFSVSLDNDQQSDWYESLPFPLASILRAWAATAPDKYLAKQALLIDFFDATVQFHAIILLSAFGSRPELFAKQRGKVRRAIQKAPGGLERTGFGTWKVVLESLSRATHELLEGKAEWDQEEGVELCQEIFADPSLQLPRMLASRKLDREVLPKVVGIRNSQWGHSGRNDDYNAQKANQRLERLLNDLRGVFGALWDNVQLIRPQTCKQRSSQGSENTVLFLKGSNREFLNEILVMPTCLSIDRLHLITEGYHHSLELLPFMRLGEAQMSAEDTCYFYKSCDSGEGDDTARFVSYHEKDQNVIDLQPGEAGGLFQFLADFKTWGAPEGLEVANDTLSDFLE